MCESHIWIWNLWEKFLFVLFAPLKEIKAKLLSASNYDDDRNSK